MFHPTLARTLTIIYAHDFQIYSFNLLTLLWGLYPVAYLTYPSVCLIDISNLISSMWNS